jgi:hypothetical protein
MSYVTFVTGAGARVETITVGKGKKYREKAGTIIEILNVAHLNGYNTYVPGGNSCFASVEGFTKDFIVKKMIEIIQERIEYYDNKNE